MLSQDISPCYRRDVITIDTLIFEPNFIGYNLNRSKQVIKIRTQKVSS